PWSRFDAPLYPGRGRSRAKTARAAPLDGPLDGPRRGTHAPRRSAVAVHRRDVHAHLQAVAGVMVGDGLVGATAIAIRHFVAVDTLLRHMLGEVAATLFV